jgi:DNA-binding NtrC family response regulator
LDRRSKILAIDDEPNIRRLIQNEFQLEGFEVSTAKDGEEGLSLFEQQIFDIVLLDIKLPRMSGIEVLKKLKQKAPLTEVFMITGYGDIETAVESLKLGAREYITKPFKLDELLTLVKELVPEGKKKIEAGSSATPANSGDNEASFVRCPSQAMQKVYEIVEKTAPTDNTILIQGETGVGKDILALQIHLASKRNQNPFISIDCGLLNSNLAESELYGHGKGAFSGASEKKIGLVERSHKGTLFLDEIGNIDLELQKKFLRFLETRTFRRVGETKEIKIDARFILATNLELQEAMQKGLMRQDLFYRMDVISIPILPLRKRPEDIPFLANFFLDQESKPSSRHEFSPQSIEILTDYSWPGNVRELKSVVTKAIIFAKSETIKPDDLPSHLLRNRKVPKKLPRTLEEVEKEYIIQVLEEMGGNQSKAASILGINRKTLYKKIHKHNIF